jgi:hypothetical protein
MENEEMDIDVLEASECDCEEVDDAPVDIISNFRKNFNYSRV